MKFAIVSDIHANLEALEAVWNDALRLGAERFICLGDAVGYGPDPQEVISRLAISHTLTVRGNHEQAIFDPHLLRRMSHEAVVTLRHTANSISPATRLWMSTLPRSHVEAGARFVHGAPPQSVLRYFTQCKGRELNSRFSLYSETVCFTGHTHLQTITREQKGKILSSLLFEGRHQLSRKVRHVVGVGSGGQPRGDGKDAEYVLWAPDNNEIQARRVPYDREATIKKLEDLKFPATLSALLR